MLFHTTLYHHYYVIISIYEYMYPTIMSILLPANLKIGTGA